MEVLALRGTPVGAEDMIERVEARLAEDPLVVANRQRGTTPIARRSEMRDPKSINGGVAGWIWAVAAFTLVVVGAAIGTLPEGYEDNTRDPMATTAPPVIDTTGMTDPEIVEAGLGAWEAGNVAAVTQLFDFAFRSRWSLDELNGELAYQARIADATPISCRAFGSEVVCEVGNTTPMADAVGVEMPSESIRFTVEDSTIFPADGVFPLPTWPAGQVSMASYLRLHGKIIYAEPWDTQLKEYTTECLEAPRQEFCATLEAKNLEGWAAWYPGTPREKIEVQVTAWFDGDCERAFLLLGDYEPLPDLNCPHPTIQYEAAMEARVEVAGCDEQPTANSLIVSCEILYSNVMNRAVDKEPAEVSRRYEVGVSLQELDANYPRDPELMDSFAQYADQQGMTSDYERACRTPQPSCADFILTWLDDWATWHRGNS
jgi:hypothetical protein